VTRPHLVDTLTGVARYLPFDRRANAMVPIDAPNKVCGAYLARQGKWHLPVLTGIANALGGRRNAQLLLDVGHHRVRQARLAEFREVLDDDAFP